MGCKRNVLVNVRIRSSGRKISSSGLKKNLLSIFVVTLMILTSFVGMLGISADNVLAADADISATDTDFNEEEVGGTSNQEIEDEKADEESATKTNMESETATVSAGETAFKSLLNEEKVSNNNENKNNDNDNSKNIFSDKTSDVPEGVSKDGWDGILSDIKNCSICFTLLVKTFIDFFELNKYKVCSISDDGKCFYTFSTNYLMFWMGFYM